MALVAGDATVAAGTMARALYDALNAQFGTETDNDDATPDTDRKNVCAAFASAIVSYITSHAEITCTIEADDIDTGLPSGNVNIDGTLS